MVTGIWTSSRSNTTREEVELVKPLLVAATKEGKTTVEIGGAVWTFKNVLVTEERPSTPTVLRK